MIGDGEGTSRAFPATGASGFRYVGDQRPASESPGTPGHIEDAWRGAPASGEIGHEGAGSGSSSMHPARRAPLRASWRGSMR